MKQKIYIAGCGGMLGEAFYALFKDEFDIKCTDKDVNEEWLSYLDFRDFDAYKKEVFDFAPDYLFHLGAHTDLEFCEQNPEDAYMTNTIGVENAVFIANELDIPLLYISTAVFLMASRSFTMTGINPGPWEYMLVPNTWVNVLWLKMRRGIWSAEQVG